MSRNKHISKKTSCFSLKRSKNTCSKTKWIWKTHFEKLTHAQTIQDADVHLACLEMQVEVARMNFDLILLAITFLVVAGQEKPPMCLWPLNMFKAKPLM